MPHVGSQKQRYNQLRKYGYRSYHPAEEAIAVIEEIRARTALNPTDIARRSGLDPSTIDKILHGQHKQVQDFTLRALTAFRDSNPAPVRAPVIGLKRRVQALQRMGWPLHELRRRMGNCVIDRVRITPPDGTVPMRTFEKVVALYDELSMIPGPSQSARTRATNKGWAPPMAWNENEIDDPDAVPHGYERVAKRMKPREVLDEYAWLLAAGASPTQAMRQLHISKKGLEKAQARIKREEEERATDTIG